MSKGRILFVVNDTQFFLSHRLNIAQAAREEGWEVSVATPADDSVVRLVKEGFQHFPIPLSRSGSNPLAELQTLWALYHLFSSYRPALIHAVTIKPVLYCGLIAPMVRVPALVQAVSGLGHIFIAAHGVARLRRWLITKAYWFAFRHPRSRVIFQNPDDAKILSGALRDKQRVLIPGAGVDPDAFPPFAEPGGVPVVVLVSRMLWAKGVGEFIEAAEELRAQGVSARFVLVGDSDPGNPAAVPPDQLDQWSRSGTVEWWGRRDDIADIFAKAHVVCLPSYREGLPKVLLEAASCGRAIVTTDAPGCRDVVTHGDNGLLVPVRDAQALAVALRTLIENPALRTLMGRRGRQRVLERFASEHVVSRTLALYEELLAPSRAMEIRH